MYWFWREMPWFCRSLGWIIHSKCSFKNIWEKKLQNISLRGLFFLCFWLSVYRSALAPQTSLPFCKTFHLRRLAVFWIRLCLDNCSVIFILTFCYVLHPTHLDFWHIQHSIFFFRYMRKYSVFFNVIKAHSNVMRHYSYSGLFRHIQASCVTLTYL